ncbi:NuoM family protein [Shewanella sp. UCD-KL12]|uniref:complex I subunit 4 family protein n=1 Tax=Shewanella sp. UCD-KL12 TaxID=1917163 RepID=UPI00097064A4|nr:NADH-quinone oxidoreductase subunit M [Shewanella sp. UCD-KL12]
MILTTLIILPLLGGVIALYSEKISTRLPKTITLVTLSLVLLLLLTTTLSNTLFNGDHRGQWLFDEGVIWIERLNIGAQLSMDGLSLALIILTLLVGLLALSSAWEEIKKHQGFFYFNFLWTFAGIIGVFLAMDLLLFFVFWEVMLVPLYFLIAIWGHENRRYAALKFFLFTQAGGLLMLLSIIALAATHYQETSILSFNYHTLIQSPIVAPIGQWICLGFILAFLVKLPAFPFHPWLPDAHTQAPTPVSIILAAILLKTGGYGLIRFVLPLFPDAVQFWSPVMLLLGVMSIIYGAVLAFAQHDLKRVVAYSSVSHMGFVVLGCFSLNYIALQGAMIQMLAHGLSSAALFMLVGLIQHKLHTRDLNQFSGLWQQLPNLSAMGLFFAVASLGMPGLGNFIGELLVLIGTFEQNAYFAVAASLGLILGAIYSLRLIQKSFWGPGKSNILAATVHLDKALATPSDLNIKQRATLFCIATGLILIGIYPQPILDLLQQPLMQILAVTRIEGVT